MKKIISICLTAAMMLAALSACANPPGEGSTTVKNPPAAASQSGKVTEAPQPVDLSVLSEDELGKIDENILNDMKKGNKNTEIRVIITLEKPMTDAEREEAVSAKLEENKIKNEEITREIEVLKSRKESIGADKAKVAEIDAQIEELETQLKKKYGLTYGYGISRVMLEEWEPILINFIKEHGLPENTIRIISSMSLRNIDLTAEKITEIAKEPDVIHIGVPESDDAKLFVNENIFTDE